MNQIGLILGGVLTNAGAQMLLKLGMNSIGRFDLTPGSVADVAPRILASPYVWSGLLSYVGSFAIWLVVLSRVQMSVAYPMISLGYIFGLIAGYFFFSEDISAPRVIGVAVIIVGVILISRS